MPNFDQSERGKEKNRKHVVYANINHLMNPLQRLREYWHEIDRKIQSSDVFLMCRSHDLMKQWLKKFGQIE